MKISLNWLRTFVPEMPESNRCAEVLTDIGLEVESLERHEAVPGGLAGVVVGHVLTVDKHPDADRLRITTVDVGSETLQIVCGAPNVAVGQKVPVALVGTTLYPIEGDPIKLKKSKIRGVESVGMICAEDELGLGKGHDGILVLDAALKPGTPVAEVLGLQGEEVVEIGLTPNRTDAMGHYGVARDLAAALRLSIESYTAAEIKGSYPCPVQVEVKVPEKCIRYSGVVIKDLKVGPSPDWLRKRLEAVGGRSINNVVDVTNYVLFELGQPLHAFDLNKIKGGKIVVRNSVGQDFVALDNVSRKLNPEDLMICDAQEELCIAGVMGGLDSGTTEGTTAIFLESASFSAATVRRSSTHHQIFSESAYRFARGADPQITLTALYKAAQLITELAGGSVSQVVDVYPTPVQPKVVEVPFVRLNSIAGAEIPTADVEDILLRLGFIVSQKNEKAVTVQVPTYRVDVYRFQDVAEEILRVYGYNNIPLPDKLNASPIFLAPTAKAFALQHRVADYLAALGYFELRTNSLVSTTHSSETSVNTLNPLSEDVAVLRTSLLPSVLEVVAYNVNRQQTDLMLFELGNTYHRSEKGYAERPWLALAHSGQDQGPHWQGAARSSGLFSLRREVERLQTWLGLPAQVVELKDDPELAYGLELRLGNMVWGRMGQVKPELAKKYEVSAPIYYACLDWQWMLGQYTKSKTTYAELPKYPAVQRDISMLVQPGISFAEMEQLVRSCDKKRITGVELFDLYQPKDSEEKSYAIRIHLLDKEQTLKDEQVNTVMEQAFAKLEATGKVRIRR